MRISDWSSDVCSSDLLARHRVERDHVAVRGAEINRIADLDRGRLEIEFLAALVLARPGQITRMIFPDAFERADIVRRDLREWAEARPRLVASVIAPRSEAHTSELQSLMRISYAVFCLQKKKY